jgi:hypothetical protein
MAWDRAITTRTLAQLPAHVNAQMTNPAAERRFRRPIHDFAEAQITRENSRISDWFADFRA